MKEYRVFPYIFRNSALMSNMSISALATIVLIRTLSVVPSPWRHTEAAFTLVHVAWISSTFICVHEIFTFIDLCKRSAKNAGLFRMHFTARQQQGFTVFSFTNVSPWRSVVQQRRTYGQKGVFQRAGHLPLDAVLDVSARNLPILIKH